MKKYFLPVAAIVLFTSCNHVYYAPNTANVPLLSERGETKINALYSAGNDSEFEGGELQVATAVSNNVAIMVNFFAAGKTDQVSRSSTNGPSTTQTEKGNGSYLELAPGLYKAFDDKKKWIGEVYGGLGFGSVTNDHGFNERSKVGITKIFLQPSVGYKSKYFEAALAPKISLVNWKVKEDNVTVQNNSNSKTSLNIIKNDPSFLAFEPSFLLRAGAKNVKMQVSLSFSNYKSSAAAIAEDLVEVMTFGMGVSINIKPRKK